jgi:putative transposase
MGERRTRQVKRRRRTPGQIIRKRREAERMLAGGKQVPEVAEGARGVRADLPPLARPVRRMTAEDVKRLRELERENVRLKRIVADKELEIDALREVAKGNW